MRKSVDTNSWKGGIAPRGVWGRGIVRCNEIGTWEVKSSMGHWEVSTEIDHEN